MQSGNLDIASHVQPRLDLLQIRADAKLLLNRNQITSNGMKPNSGLTIEANALLQIRNENGLFDGSVNSAISGANGMDYSLDENSTIEYAANQTQFVTGLNDKPAHQYGILEINVCGKSHTCFAYQAQQSVAVRKQFLLNQGEYKLNGEKLIIKNGSTTAIVRKNGFIRSETRNAENKSEIVWENVFMGTHIFPFGADSGSYLPVTFNVTDGAGNSITASTRPTNMDNLPLTVQNGFNTIPNLNIFNEGDEAYTKIIDRWWNFEAPGITADVTLTYKGYENTCSSEIATKNFGIMKWTGTYWSGLTGLGTGVTQGIGSVSIFGAHSFGPWILASEGIDPAIQLVRFEASRDHIKATCEWSVIDQQNCKQYIIERSADKNLFTLVSTIEKTGAITGRTDYDLIDPSPLNGTSWYRLGTIDYDNKIQYYDPVQVNNIEGPASDGFSFNLFPNPFHDHLTLNLVLPGDGNPEINMMDITGRHFCSWVIDAVPGPGKYDLNFDRVVPSGVYMIEVNFSGRVYTKRLVKL